MEKKDKFTKMLVIAGNVLVWLTILAPVLFSALVLIRAREFHLDYLMPAELFLVVLAGGGLLLWGAQRAHSPRRKLIGGSLIFAVAMLVGAQALAVVTGLASGKIEATGWQWALVLTGILLYDLLVIVMGVGGILLLRDLFKPAPTLPAAGMSE